MKEIVFLKQKAFTTLLFVDEFYCKERDTLPFGCFSDAGSKIKRPSTV